MATKGVKTSFYISSENWLRLTAKAKDEDRSISYLVNRLVEQAQWPTPEKKEQSERQEPVAA